MKLLSIALGAMLAATSAYGQTIAVPNLPVTTSATQLTDYVVSQSSCGTCLMTISNVLTAGLNAPNTWSVRQSINISTTVANTQDAYGINVQLNNPSASAVQIYSMLCAGCRPNAEAVRGVATATSGTTDTNTTGISGYVLNQNASGGNGQNSVALFGVGISAVDNAETWGVNTTVADSTVGFTPSSGVGRFLLSELDYNVTSTSTRVIGLVVQGGSIAQPSSSTGVLVGNLNLAAAASANQGASVPWQQAFNSNNGAAAVALYVGSTRLDGAANQNSQYIAFAFRAANGAAGAMLMYGDTFGNLVTTAPAIINASDNVMSIGGLNNNINEVWTNSIRLKATTVGGLPACASFQVGQMYFVTDASSPAVYSALTGGGGYGMLVTCFNGVWVPH